jgi:hypothetical protein
LLLDCFRVSALKAPAATATKKLRVRGHRHDRDQDDA